MKSDLREIATRAIRFWERCRIIYNGILAIIVAVYFCIYFPESLQAVSVDGFLLFFVLAVIANVLFCAAYVPDFVAQLSDVQPLWSKVRWALFIIGLLVAGIFTRWICLASFATLQHS